MATDLWFEKYHGPAGGTSLYGRCAACEYEGPKEDFRIWRRGLRQKVLCNQCSADVRATMEHEGWQRDPR